MEKNVRKLQMIESYLNNVMFNAVYHIETLMDDSGLPFEHKAYDDLYLLKGNIETLRKTIFLAARGK